MSGGMSYQSNVYSSIKEDGGIAGVCFSTEVSLSQRQGYRIVKAHFKSSSCPLCNKELVPVRTGCFSLHACSSPRLPTCLLASLCVAINPRAPTCIPMYVSYPIYLPTLLTYTYI